MYGLIGFDFIYQLAHSLFLAFDIKIDNFVCIPLLRLSYEKVSTSTLLLSDSL